MTFNLSAQKALYNILSSEAGVPISELRPLLSVHFKDDRSNQDLNDYRQGRNGWKKLRDEVVPTSKFLNSIKVEGRVRFPLDNNPPDAWIMPEDQEKIGLEVTLTLGRTSFELAREKVRNGLSPGFLGLQDDIPQADFDATLSRDRKMYNTKQALDTVRDGIATSLTKKHHNRYKGMWLLIVAPLGLLPRERWDAIVPCLRKLASPMPFNQIHVIADDGQPPVILRLK